MTLPQSGDVVEEIMRDLDRNRRRIEDLEGIEIPFLQDVQVGAGGDGGGRELVRKIEPTGSDDVVFDEIIDDVDQTKFRHLQVMYLANYEEDAATGESALFLRLNGNTTAGAYNFTKHRAGKSLSTDGDIHTIDGADEDEISVGELPTIDDADLDGSEHGFGWVDFTYWAEQTFKGIHIFHGTFRAGGSGSFANMKILQTWARFEETVEIDEIRFFSFGSGAQWGGDTVFSLYALT